jgi:Uma2 family endonuclease
MTSIISLNFDPDKEYEIIAGQPEEKTMGGARHSGVGVRLIMRLASHVETHQLGGVYGPDATFQIGENQRIPDVAFVAATRFPVDGEPEGIWPMPPDLAVEIISPYDLYGKGHQQGRRVFGSRGATGMVNLFGTQNHHDLFFANAHDDSDGSG